MSVEKYIMKSVLVFSFLLLLGNISSKAQDTAGNNSYIRDNINAVLWQQRSGEYRALAFQAYNIAHLRLEMGLKKKYQKPLCIIVDIDETILDNSRFEGYELSKSVTFTEADWNKWVNDAEADTIPGACSFLKFAATKKVAVFYITNRDKSQYTATLKNLEKFGFPFADENHLFVNNNASKEPLRQKIMRHYEVALLCGDDLNDFTDIFYNKDADERQTIVNNIQRQFGDKFIVLPNPMYGDWEEALYHYKNGLSKQQKSKIREEAIKK